MTRGANKPQLLGATEIDISPALKKPITKNADEEQGYDLPQVPIYFNDEYVVFFKVVFKYIYIIADFFNSERSGP